MPGTLVSITQPLGVITVTRCHAEHFWVPSSPNPASQVAGQYCGAGANPWALAFQCPLAISSCQFLHLCEALYKTAEAPLAMQAEPEAGVSPTPTQE